MKRIIFWTSLVILLVNINTAHAGNWVYSPTSLKWEKDITPSVFKFNSTNTASVRTWINPVTGGANPNPVITNATGQDLTNGYFAVTGGQIATGDETDPTNVRKAFTIADTSLIAPSTLRFAQSSALVTDDKAGKFLGFVNLNWYIPSIYNYTNYTIAFTCRVNNPYTYGLELLVYNELGTQLGTTQNLYTKGWNNSTFTQASTSSGDRPFRFKMSIPNTTGLFAYYETPVMKLINTTEPAVRTISVSTTGAGNVTSTYATVRDQDNQIFTITPRSGQTLISTKYNGVTVTPIDNGNGTYTYTTPLLTANGTLAVQFSYIQISTAGGNLSTLGYTPTEISNSDITVTEGKLLIDMNASVKSLTVNPGAQVTLNSGKTLNPGTLTLESNAINGTATFVDEGGTLTATTTTIQQALAAGRNWWYLSSPLSNAFTGTVFSGSQVGKYDETSFNYTAPFGTSTKMDAGVGYVIKFPNTNAQALTFTGGSLNTGTVSPTLTRTGTSDGKRGFNLIGNPYPSYLNWDEVYADQNNPATNIRNAIWFRTYDGGMKFHTYGDGDGVPEVTSPKIAPMQAFWVKVNADGSNGSLTFKNTQRSHFTAGSNPLKVKAIDDRQRLRIVISDGNAQDEMLIVGKTYASNGVDSYDIEKMSNDNAAIPEIYSLVSNQEFVINSISPIVENQEIKLGLRPSAAGSFSIRASQIQNIPAGLRVILKDALRDTETELTDGVSYSFVTGTETVDNRFSIQFRTTGAITLLPENNQSEVLVFVNPSKQIEIVNSANWAPNTRIMLYNAAGQKVTECVPTGNRTVVSTPLRGGIYIVHVENATQSVKHKVILR